MLTALAIAAVLNGPVATPIDRTDTPSPLHGTLLTPAGDTRAVAVIIAGSGPTDRDGDSPGMGIVAAPYRLLAEGLAERGVATVRYDKRGAGANVMASIPEDKLRFDDFVADARAFAAEAITRTGRPCAWLIGHSEGALVAEVAAQANPQVCGLILLAPAGRPAAEVLREQFGQAPEPYRGQAFAVLDALEAGTEPPAVDPALAAGFRASIYPYLRSWFALDPAALLAAYDGPVLIARGTTDIQVSAADLDALAAAQPSARIVRWEGVNHVLKVAPEDRAANIAAYMNPDLPLAPGVVDDVAGFVLEHPAP
ncbi:alpha/beta hydrolase [Brevundimonas sp. Leaf363]|uniref:alpha/beta hydrolase n=1 Tax=Brevundimonas sp. Leaf363 TaxID=1736353 RepID=UPI0006FE49FF|nr:alpha/beta hydrolase [Brevundimonas sp. Leaf363]KQS53924.1 alpha/beta hydrolase [Brevundimonas sp. Leaf363]